MIQFRYVSERCSESKYKFPNTYKDITLYVNSPGGSVTAGMAVFDTMRHIRPSVSTVCVGLAASMGEVYFPRLIHKIKFLFRGVSSCIRSAGRIL